MTGRRFVSTNTKWEFQFGYSRAVRQGEVIRVAGTAGLDQNGQVVPGGVAEQVKRSLEIVGNSLQELGAQFTDIIAVRAYIKDATDAEEVAVVLGEAFRDIKPALTIVQVGFVAPDILVELEVEAIAA